MDPLLAAS